MSKAMRPLAGRQWRAAADKRPVLSLPEAKPPAARLPAAPTAPRATAQALPRVSPREEAAREMARKIADRYVSRDGRILKPWR
jgi:hypothetical protein